MEPSIWGPHGWFFLHSITMNYPENPTEIDKLNYKTFFNSLGKVLPCSICQNNFHKHTHLYNIDNALNSRKDLVIWLFNIHNEANKSLKKKKITYEQFIEKYKKIYSNKLPIYNNINTNYNIYHILILFFIFILLYIMFFI
jgi:hypothetical protein